MILKTIPESIKALKACGISLSVNTMRRDAYAGKIPFLMLGKRALIDYESAYAFYVVRRGITIKEVSQLTGMGITSIRRAISSGWMPCNKIGRAYVFQIDEVMAAIKERMELLKRNKKG